MNLIMLRDHVRMALEAKDQHALEVLAFIAGTQPDGDEFKRIAEEELAKLPHELHEWWEGPCNCEGTLN